MLKMWKFQKVAFYGPYSCIGIASDAWKSEILIVLFWCVTDDVLEVPFFYTGIWKEFNFA